MASTLQSTNRLLQPTAFATPLLMGQYIRVPLGVNKLPRSNIYPLSKRYRMCSNLVKLPTGVNMEVIEVPAKQPSSPEKPPLIFVHGSFHGAWCFRLFQPFFASHGFSSYAVSLRGAGNTEAVLASNPTVQEHLSDLSSLLRLLDLPAPPVIIGHSIGGFIVQKWVEQEGDRPPSAMILMASTPPSGNSKLVKRIMSKVGFWKTFRITMGFIRRNVTKDLALCREMFFSPKTVEWFSEDIEGDDKLKEYMDLFNKTSKTLNVKSLKNVVKGTGYLKGKVFVIGGTADSLVDETALEESANLWAADLAILKDAPHDIMLYSKWEETASQIVEWITNKVICDKKTSSLP